MIKAPRPTRAEGSDVSNAVLDGTDCVMLSGESANGLYPQSAVSIMAKICLEAEKTIDYYELYKKIINMTPYPVSTPEAVALGACSTVLHAGNIKLIIVITDTGKLVRLAMKYRPEVPILGCSTNESLVRWMYTMRGVVPLKVGYKDSYVLPWVVFEAKERGLVQTGDKAAVIHAKDMKNIDDANAMKILTIE